MDLFRTVNTIFDGLCILWKLQVFRALYIMDMKSYLLLFFSTASLSVFSLFKSQTLLKLPSDNPLHSVPSLISLLRASANTIT